VLRMFSIIDIGEKVQLSKILGWSVFNGYLFMDRFTAYAYTKDDEPNLDAINPSDFKKLGEVKYPGPCKY